MMSLHLSDPLQNTKPYINYELAQKLATVTPLSVDIICECPLERYVIFAVIARPPADLCVCRQHCSFPLLAVVRLRSLDFAPP